MDVGMGPRELDPDAALIRELAQWCERLAAAAPEHCHVGPICQRTADALEAPAVRPWPATKGDPQLRFARLSAVRVESLPILNPINRREASS